MPDDLSEGQRLSIFCSARSGTPPISFSWLKNGNAIGNLSGAKVIHLDDFQDQLQIESLSIDHVGNYSCNAKNLYGSNRMTVQVNMKFAPRWVSSTVSDGHSASIKGVAGETVEIDCRAMGHPSPTVNIMKG